MEWSGLAGRHIQLAGSCHRLYIVLTRCDLTATSQTLSPDARAKNPKRLEPQAVRKTPSVVNPHPPKRVQTAATLIDHGKQPNALFYIPDQATASRLQPGWSTRCCEKEAPLLSFNQISIKNRSKTCIFSLFSFKLHLFFFLRKKFFFSLLSFG